MKPGPMAELLGQSMRDGFLAWIGANTQADPAGR
jgi:hypothetical protein